LVDFATLVEIIGSSTRLHLLELIAERPRSITELAKTLGVTQQAVMKHLAMLERNDIVQQLKIDSRSKVRSVYAISKSLSLGYVFQNGILCLYIGSGDYSITGSSDIETLREMAYSRNLLRMRTKVVANRLRALIEDDLRMQAEIRDVMKKLRLSPLQVVALHCLLSTDSKKHFEEASKALGLGLRDTIKHIEQSEG